MLRKREQYYQQMVSLHREQHGIAGRLATKVRKVCSVFRILHLYLLLRHKFLSWNTNNLSLCVSAESALLIKQGKTKWKTDALKPMQLKLVTTHC